jgi:nicotinate-nucleotide adenylyltransferase
MKPTPEQGGNWGILGGTFDPVHRGHLALARGIYEQKKLIGVLFVPSIGHPFKQGQCQASFSDRVAMLRLAVENHECFLVSEIEAEMSLNGYTLDTVRACKQRYPLAEFSFIVGADILDELKHWHNPEQILKEVKVLVGSRPPYDKKQLVAQKQLAAFPSDKIELVPTSLIEVSSTEVRQEIRDNVSPDELDRLIPSKVRRYIQQRELYR